MYLSNRANSFLRVVWYSQIQHHVDVRLVAAVTWGQVSILMLIKAAAWVV